MIAAAVGVRRLLADSGATEFTDPGCESVLLQSSPLQIGGQQTFSRHNLFMNNSSSLATYL
jgi:hypothetical protein